MIEDLLDLVLVTYQKETGESLTTGFNKKRLPVLSPIASIVTEPSDIIFDGSLDPHPGPLTIFVVCRVTENHSLDSLP